MATKKQTAITASAMAEPVTLPSSDNESESTGVMIGP